MINILREIIKKNNIDGIILEDQFDVIEALNVNRAFNFLEISPVLLVTPERLFLMGDLYTMEALKECEVEKITVENDEYLRNGMSIKNRMVKLLRRERIHRLGAFIPMEIPGIEIVLLPDPFRELYSCSDEDTVKSSISESVGVVKNVLKNIKDGISSCRTEIELRNWVDSHLYREGGEKRGYPTKVIAGEKTSNPNAVSDNFPIVSPVLVNFGALVGRRGVGMARTFFLQDHEAEEVYNVLLTVKNKLYDFIKPGRIASTVYKKYIRYLGEYGLERYAYGPISRPLLPLRKGIHISPMATEVLVPDMVFHIELSLYIPGRYGVKYMEPVVLKESLEPL